MQGDIDSYPTLEELLDEPLQFVQKSVKLIASWYDYFSENNRHFREDVFFMEVDQWSPSDRAARKISRQPILTFNYVKPIFMQLLGEQRTQEPDVMVSPKNKHVDTKEVEMIGDIIRDQFEKNNSPVVFQTAFKYQIMGGYASIFHTIEYESEKSLTKKVCIKAIENVTSSFFDPNAKLPDKRDGLFNGYLEDVSKHEFMKRWPDAIWNSSFPSFRNDPVFYNYWHVDNYVRLAHLWIKLEYKSTIVRLSDGIDYELSEAKKMIEERESKISKFKKLLSGGFMNQAQMPEKLEIVKEKKDAVCHKIFYVIMNYSEVLECQEWPSDQMNGIFLDCESTLIDGRQTTISFFRTLQDPQRYVNYLKSQSAEVILNGHHVSWMGTPNNVKGKLLDDWKNPQQSKSILLANYDEKGNLPQAVMPPQISSAFESQSNQAIQDISNISGRHEASMGRQGNEKSGVAIEKRGMTSSLASFLPFDNLRFAISRSGNIIKDLLPAIFDDETEISIGTKSGSTKFMKINQRVGAKVYNDMSNVRHMNVTVDVGASYAVQKMANYQMFMQLMQINPQLSTILLDLAAENIDLDNINQVVDRIKNNIIPPEILAKEEGRELPPPTPEQQKMQQLQQQAQQAAMMLPVQKLQLEAHKAKLEDRKVDIDEHRLGIEQQEQMHQLNQDTMEMKLEQQRVMAELMRTREEARKSGIEHHVKMFEMGLKHGNEGRKQIKNA